MKKFFLLFLLVMVTSTTATAAIINIDLELDADNVPTFWTYTPTGISVDYQLGDMLVIEFGFGDDYVTVSDNDGVNWITPWLVSSASSHTIANATLGYRNLTGNIINLPFTLADTNSCCGHLGGFRWDNFLDAGNSITLTSFIATFEVTAATLNPIIGHYFGLNGVTITNNGMIPVQQQIPEPETLAIFGMGLLMMSLRKKIIR